MIRENVVAAYDLFDALTTTLRAHADSGDAGPYCSGGVSVMDVVWWQTGLSPTKYDAEPIPTMHAWKIVRRWPPTLDAFAERLAAEQVDLDPESERVLRDNLWTLYG